MNRYSDFQKSVAVLLSFCFIILSSGCYTIKGIPKNEIMLAGKTEYIIHGHESLYRLGGVNISEGSLVGTINYSKAGPKKPKTIHLYVAPDSAIKVDKYAISVPLTNVVKAEVNRLDGGKTTLAALGIGSAISFTFLLILLLTKGSSCPFIYISDGNEYAFNGEIFSGATALPLERDDYLPLSDIKAVGDNYMLKITNEVDEIQNTNMVELIVADHDPAIKVMMDKYGYAHSISNPVKPLKATDTYGESILDLVVEQDDLRYLSAIKPDQFFYDTISLSFIKPANASSSKLIINGKNTMWLDYMFGQFADLFGNRYDNWKEKRNSKTSEELLSWTLAQGFPLKVFAETTSGLKFIDYFNLAGPMGDKKDVLELDLSDIQTDVVKIKLVSGMLFWDIDYVGLDFSRDTELNTTTIPLYSATDEQGKDVTNLLSHDDKEYLIQPDPINETILSFRATEKNPGLERTVFLHSKGNYEILRHTKGKPDIEYLNSFMEPGAFPKFSKDHFLNYFTAR